MATDDERTPVLVVPTGGISDRLERLARALAGAGLQCARSSGLVDGAEPIVVASSLEEIEKILVDLEGQVGGARNAVAQVRAEVSAKC